MRHQNVEWRSEAYWLNKVLLAPDGSGSDTIDAWGMYSYLQGKISRTIDIGIRGDLYVPDTKSYANLSSSLSLSPLAVTRDDPHLWQIGPYFTWRRSPYVKFRAEYDYSDGKGIENPEHVIWLQTVIDSSGNAKIRSGKPGYVSASAGMKLLEKPQTLSRAEGGVHIYGNLSAVNYYFHGKENLYIEVFNRQMNKFGSQDSPNISEVLCKIGTQTTLQQLIRTFCKAFLQPLLESSDNNTVLKLVMKEQQNPHLPRHFREHLVLPKQAEMKNALVKACPELDDSVADLCVHSIVGQLYHLIQTHALFNETNHKDMPILDLPTSIEHIVKFSVAGVKQYVNLKS